MTGAITGAVTGDRSRSAGVECWGNPELCSLKIGAKPQNPISIKAKAALKHSLACRECCWLLCRLALPERCARQSGFPEFIDAPVASHRIGSFSLSLSRLHPSRTCTPHTTHRTGSSRHASWPGCQVAMLPWLPGSIGTGRMVSGIATPTSAPPALPSSSGQAACVA